MEFLDSLDFEINKKPNRVRSWYLYEQYKSLESNQLEAARKLKSRCYQEKVLRRELSERKARRSLYDQYESRTGSRITTSVRSVDTKTSLAASNDVFFEGCYQLEDEAVHDENSVQDELSAHAVHSEPELARQDDSQDESVIELSSDFKSIVDLDDSIASVVENLKDSENITDEIKEELEFVIHGIAENISLQLEEAKENIKCLEEFSEFCEGGDISDQEFCQKQSEDSIHSNVDEETKLNVRKQEKTNDSSLVSVWMKLVSFAYQIINLNHGGNCYCDYSSQFLTAVLACDVIRRSCSRMCDILQPYVCPIVFVNDDGQTSTSCYIKYKNKKNNKKNRAVDIDETCSRRNIVQYKKNPVCKCQYCSKRYKSENFLNPKNKSRCQDKYNSEKFSAMCTSKCGNRKYNTEFPKYSAENRNNKRRIASDPLPGVAKNSFSPENSKTHSTLWPSELQSEKSLTYHCPCRARVRNPMLKIARYIDDIVHMDLS